MIKEEDKQPCDERRREREREKEREREREREITDKTNSGCTRCCNFFTPM